ncbi:hypothetical protein LTS10_011751 [Elasticomyces elasticus]|nr:hypothetical protein LTS10_011751 [Elasticomyces elasticus]
MALKVEPVPIGAVPGEVMGYSPVRGGLGVVTGLGALPDAAVPLIPPLPPMLPEATNPELYAEPPVFDMTVRDVTAGRETVEPEAAVPEAPSAPPPPEAMKPELYAVPYVTVMTVTVLSGALPAPPNTNARPSNRPANPIHHSPTGLFLPKPSSNGSSTTRTLQPNEELDLAMALVFTDFLENRGGCTPGVLWQIVDGGFRCGAYVGPLVHFLLDEEADRMESEPGHRPGVVIAREEDE